MAALEGFRGDDAVMQLPSTPARPIEVDRRHDRPQSRLDRDRGRGMTVTVGRVRPCPVHHLRIVALGHNLVRGAAGAAIQNAELCVAAGKI
jgi:aspartate-semialdehyde dehydrogenase